MTRRPDHYLKEARLYRFLSVVFLISGLGAFFMYYLENIDGRLFQALTEFYTLFWLLFAFGPAAILSQLSYVAYRKYLDAVSKSRK